MAVTGGTRRIVGGVDIPFDKGLLGHSDADVLLHAICDALLGAAALGDIGRHFPDTDPRYKGIDSRELLRHVAKLVREQGLEVSNVDATIVAQAPIPEQARDVAQQLAAVDAVVLRVAVGKMPADVAQRRRAEQRVADRVQQHVGVAVAREALVVRNLDAADHEPAPGDEGMHVETLADAKHVHSPLNRMRASCMSPA